MGKPPSDMCLSELVGLASDAGVAVFGPMRVTGKD